MTRYGRSTTSSATYPLSSDQVSDEMSTLDYTSVLSSGCSTTPAQEPPDLLLRGGIVAADGRGMFQTLAPSRVRIKQPSKRLEANQIKRCHEHLVRLQRETLLSTHRPTAPETELTAMFIDMLRPDSPKSQTLFTFGDWITSIPIRIGSSAVITTAAEFLLHSFDFYGEDSYSRRIRAMRTKSKALKDLQLNLLASNQAPTYDLVLATKMHYAAEVTYLSSSIDTC